MIVIQMQNSYEMYPHFDAQMAGQLIPYELDLHPKTIVCLYPLIGFSSPALQQ